MTVVFVFRLHQDPPLVLVEDMSRTHGGKTVTNAAEEVIERLRRYVPDLASRRVLYRDTDGLWDELRISQQPTFVGYGLLRARSELGAIEAVRPGVLDALAKPSAAP